MIEVDQALDLIFNEYLLAYNVEMDSWNPDIDWQGQSLVVLCASLPNRLADLDANL